MPGALADWSLIDGDPPPQAVKRISFVLFLADGECALLRDVNGRLMLPSGELEPGEHWLLDACLRIALMTAGFRIQRVHPVALSGQHLCVWATGDRYAGSRPHVSVPLATGQPQRMVEQLRADGQRVIADLLAAEVRSYSQQDEAGYFADNLRLLEPTYLRATTPEGQSGFGSDSVEWRLAREPIIDGITHDGSFLDVGCANGLLMESVQAWCSERGIHVEPFGIDFAPRLVELAGRRLPHWADRVWVGNAIDWVHPEGMRFDYVHTLLDCVPQNAWHRLIEHHRTRLARPGGRLLVSHYVLPLSRAPSAAQILDELGYTVAGVSPTQPNRPGALPRTAWLACE